MQRLSPRVFVWFEEVTARRGIALAELCDGTGLGPDSIRSRAVGPTWEQFAHLNQRFGELAGFEQLRIAGRETFDGQFLAPLIKLGALLLGPGRLYELPIRGLGARIFPGLERRVTRLDDRSVEVELAVADCQRSLESWFQVVLGGFESMPVILGLERAAATWEIGPARATYRFVVPRARWSTRLRGFRRLAQAITLVDDLIAREDEVRVLAEDRARKVEEVEHAEHLFRTVVQSISEVVAILNPDGTTRFMSEAIEPVLGTPAAGLVGAPPFDQLLPEDAAASRAVFEELGRAPYAVRAWTVRARARSGELKTLEITAKNLVDDPQVRGFLCVARDVTQRRALEEQLHHAQRLESVGRLAGGVAHDFNNILAAVMAHAELARQGLPPGDVAREDIAAIESAARRAAELTQQLLIFARKQVIQPSVIDLNSLLTSMRRLLERVLGDDVELVTTFDGPLWAVEADVGQVEQVVMNLAINARDAMPAGGRLVLATANVTIDESAAGQPGLPPGQYVRLSVIDDGEGMDEATRERIFEPFFTTKEVGKGTGLGLATVYGVVSKFGGQIAVQSAPGAGTSFEILLPRTHKVPATTPLAGTKANRGQGETVLVVEDHDSLRRVVVRSLTEGGYHVLEAPNPREALAASDAHAGPIQLLLTDVMMPEMTGKALAEKLLARRPEVLVIYMSGYTEETVLHQGMPDEGVHFLPKPFTPSVLLAKLREVLEAPAALRGKHVLH
ncbi:MAG: response regulator [Polyangiaceae bacterium]|nr:response regulator [Polyangiaceae bacterium]